MKTKYQIVIVGAGINGMLMSLALAKSNFKVCLIDSKKTFLNNLQIFDGRSFSIIDSSVQMLKNLEIWNYLKSRSQQINNITVKTKNLNQNYFDSYINFNSKKISYEPMGYIVEERFLKYSLYNEIKKFKNIDIFFDKKISIIEKNFNCNSLTFEDKTKIECNLLIGADGKNSFVGKSFNLKRIVFDFGQISIVGAVKHEKPHDGNAYQFFFPGGPFAILPMKKNISSFVWTNKEQKMKNILKLNKKDYLKELEKRFCGILGSFNLIGKRYDFPLSFNISRKITDKRLALIGEAANSVHPIAGQGLNLGLRDVATLFEVIVEAKNRGEDFGDISVLNRYESWRSLDRLSVSASTTFANSFFSNNKYFLNVIKSKCMDFTNSNDFLKNIFCKEAMGRSGEIPKIMRSENVF